MLLIIIRAVRYDECFTRVHSESICSQKERGFCVTARDRGRVALMKEKARQRKSTEQSPENS